MSRIVKVSGRTGAVTELAPYGLGSRIELGPPPKARRGKPPPSTGEQPIRVTVGARHSTRYVVECTDREWRELARHVDKALRANR